jgi:hypothetical protein
MLNGADHVLLDRAHRYAEAVGDVAVGVTLEAAQNEDGAGPFWQGLERSHRILKRLPRLQYPQRIEVDAAVMLRVELDVIVGVSDGPAAVTVGEHARSRLEDVGGHVLDGLARPSRSDP